MSDNGPATPGGRRSGNDKRQLSLKRLEQWTNEDATNELKKYCRSEEAPGVPLASPLALCDPLVEIVLMERQTFTLHFLETMGPTMQRYQKFAERAVADSANYFERDDVKALLAPRGRIFQLPVRIIDDDNDVTALQGAASAGSPGIAATTKASPKLKGSVGVKPASSPKSAAKTLPSSKSAAGKPSELKKAASFGKSLFAATAGNAASESDDDSTDSDESDAVEPSADAPKIPPPDNQSLQRHMETLMVEARRLDMNLTLIQEWFTLNVPGYTADDESMLAIVAKLVEEIGDTREVAADRYDFYGTYLDVRAGLEGNALKYPDVQGYRELLVARDHAAWEELIRSWGLLASAVATLNKTFSDNLKYVVAEEPDDVHEAHESTLFM